MKITGGNSYIKFDLENGYMLKAQGEMLINRTFVVYKSSIKNWESPHENEKLSEEQINKIIQEVNKGISKDTIKIEFE